MWPINAGTSTCQDGEVKLVDHTEFEGRVEMCYNGVWGVVCANGWDNVAANIVCNQLGYRNHSEFNSFLRCVVNFTTLF